MKPRTPYLLAGLTLITFAAAAAAGCVAGTRGSSRANQPTYLNQSTGPDAPTEAYGRPPQQIGSLPLFLPGRLDQRLVNFQVVDGVAVYEGDIMLGPVASLPVRYGLPKVANPRVKAAVAVSSDSYLWPSGEIPYAINGNVTQQQLSYIQWAIAHVNGTELKVRPRAGGEADYVTFDGGGSGCTSYVGRIRGSQEIQVAGCGSGGSVAHEILHAAGFYHEHGRSDRDAYVTVVYDEIAPGYAYAFDNRQDAQNIGPYDYQSIMHYSRMAFSKSGKPTIIPRDPNAKIGQRDGLSALDRAGVTHLYGGGSAPPPTTTFPPTTPPTTVPTTTTPPTSPPTSPPPVAGGSFAGSYASQRGDVTCTQRDATVTCQYPGGSLLCAAQGENLECGWSGGGQGRAAFTRQAGGVLAGTFGDFFSKDSRGRWDLTPKGAAPPPTATGTGTAYTPPPATGSLAGPFASTRGPMTCTESGTSVVCDFQESGTPGRMSCVKDGSGLQLSCNWATFFPMPGIGRAAFSRTAASDRNLTGTWGRLNSTTDGGKWDMQGQ
jgi:hypothetical protein